MSLVYRRFFAISLPTVAAILSILWLRNRRKGRHLPADKKEINCSDRIEEEITTDSLLLTSDLNKENKNKADQICLSVVEASISTESTFVISDQCEVCMKNTEDSINIEKTELLDYLVNPTILKENHNTSEVYTSELEATQLTTSGKVNLESEISDIANISEVDLKIEKEQFKEAVPTLDLDKMKKETGELAEQLASLELDQMKMDIAKSGSERDSANHSPSEVMLASPSISSFSDAHSEGSSDSGKGQSDLATSPAGGSSLAGDQAALYEFVLPQVIVGRLIGRHGVFLNEIKTQTHTNIFIKRHPDSNKLKVCGIEGTQQDIDKALAKIRQKFPLRRFPQLTLEKVSFVQLKPLPPLKPEDFHLQLVEGVNNDVVLSSLISAAHFFIQQPSHPSYPSLTALNTIMRHIYSSGQAPVLEVPVNFAVCAAPALEGWYRAQIIQVEEDCQHCTVKYLDYGGYSRIAASELRQIRGDLLTLPFQAVECYLANVAPPPGQEWSDEALLLVHRLTYGQILHAQVYDYAEDGAPLVYLYSSSGNQVVLINEALVLNGFAVITDSSNISGTTSEDGGPTDEETLKNDKETEE